MQKKLQRKMPIAVLKVLASLKKREADLMKQLERVRSEMTEVSKFVPPPVEEYRKAVQAKLSQQAER